VGLKTLIFYEVRHVAISHIYVQTDQCFVEVVQVFGFFYLKLWGFGGSVDRVLDTIDSAIVDQFVGFAEYPVVERDGGNKIKTP